jgi:hypothetical protein
MSLNTLRVFSYRQNGLLTEIIARWSTTFNKTILFCWTSLRTINLLLCLYIFTFTCIYRLSFLQVFSMCILAQEPKAYLDVWLCPLDQAIGLLITGGRGGYIYASVDFAGLNYSNIGSVDCQEEVKEREITVLQSKLQSPSLLKAGDTYTFGGMVEITFSKKDFHYWCRLNSASWFKI